jgi:virulence factor Mce-like protein
MRSRGAALAAAIVILVTSSALAVDRVSRVGSYRITAYFPRAIGLFTRSTVRVLGVEVGRVGEVTPVGDRVRVGLNIRGDVKIPQGASAIIVPISLISDRYVQLAPVYDGGPVMRDGDELPAERNVVPAELDDLLKTLKVFLEALEPGSPGSPGALGQLIRNADQALAGKGEQLGTTLDGLSTLLDVLGRNASHLDSTIVSLDQLLGVLARKDAALAATNRGLAQVFSALAEERSHLEQGLGHLADLLDVSGEIVRAHKADLLDDLQTLSVTSDILVRQREALLRNIVWLPVLAEGFVRAVDTTVSPPRVRVRDNQGVRGG